VCVREMYITYLVEGDDLAEVDGAKSRSPGGGLNLLGLRRLTKDPPESEGLISSRRHDGGTIRRLGHMEDTSGMSGHLSHLLHGRVLPEAELVLRVTVR